MMSGKTIQLETLAFGFTKATHLARSVQLRLVKGVLPGINSFMWSLKTVDKNQLTVTSQQKAIILPIFVYEN